MPSSQKYSTSVRCLSRPSSVRDDGGDAASFSCSGVRPEHFHSSVSRCASRKALSMTCSSPLRGTSARPPSVTLYLHAGDPQGIEYIGCPLSVQSVVVCH